MLCGFQEYAEREYVLPDGEQAGELIKLDDSPWMREPMEALEDPEVHQVSMYFSVQTGKSTVLVMYAAWILDHWPRNIIVNVLTDTKAREFGERVLPCLERVKSIGKRVGKRLLGKMVRLTLSLPEVWLKIQHASHANAQSDPASVVINDEAWQYEPGRMAEFLDRSSQSQMWKEVNASTGGLKDSEMDERVESGHKAEYALACQGCGEHFVPLMGDRAEKRYGRQVFVFDMPDDIWDQGAPGVPTFAEVAKTVRCVCPNPKCNHVHHDTPAVRYAMALEGGYMVRNPRADRSQRSFRLNAFVPPWVRWADLIKLWLPAIEMTRMGFSHLLENFVRKQLAEAWDGSGVAGESELKNPGTFSNESPRWEIVHPPAEEGGEPTIEVVEYKTAITVDVQKDHFWVMVCYWASGYRVRIVDYLRVESWGDIDKIVEKYPVPTPQCVGVDAGYGSKEGPDVNRNCAERGWVTYTGQDRNTLYPWTKKGAVTSELPYAPAKTVRVGEGTTEARGRQWVDRTDWSNLHIKNAAHKLMAGRVEKGSLEIAKEYEGWGLNGDFEKQMLSEKKEITLSKHGKRKSAIWVPKSKGRPNNHALDCFCLQIIKGWKLDCV